MVTIGATLLLAPLLWDHYLAALLLPAAFLAQRGRWWGLLLPSPGLGGDGIMAYPGRSRAAAGHRGHARAVRGAATA